MQIPEKIQVREYAPINRDMGDRVQTKFGPVSILFNGVQIVISTLENENIVVNGIPYYLGSVYLDYNDHNKKWSVNFNSYIRRTGRTVFENNRPTSNAYNKISEEMNRVGNDWYNNSPKSVLRDKIKNIENAICRVEGKYNELIDEMIKLKKERDELLQQEKNLREQYNSPHRENRPTP